MTTATAPTTLTAVRTWKSGKATVTVYMDGEVLNRAGGARAGRAQAALVTRWEVPGRTPKTSIYGIRGDLGAAQTEAHKLATATTMRHSGMVLECTPATWAAAVPVTEA